MKVSEVLKLIDLGSSVAEYDEALEKYFVETEVFRVLVRGDVDVVAGDKGTGKTAIFKMLQRKYRELPELEDVEVITAFNPSGNPVFQRLVQDAPLSEGQYRSVWKAYFLSLVGNWALNIAGHDGSESFGRLNALLEGAGLRFQDDTAATVFGRLWNSLRGYLHPSAAEAKLTLSETGIPIVTPRLEFGAQKTDTPNSAGEVPHEAALTLLDSCLEELGYDVWVVLDRLDEAFQGFPTVEVPALRALFRCYLDLMEFKHIHLKLFVRRDLFRKIIGEGFVNLTHINARKIEIVWDEEDLLNLLCERVKESGAFLGTIGVAADASNTQIFDSIFPPQVDAGERKPTTWNWIMSRVRDANGVKPPRNLLDLVMKAREEQSRREGRESRDFELGKPIIVPESIRGALARLSEQRVEDTLLAEAGEAVDLIVRFRKQKSEYDKQSLAALLGVSGEDLEAAIRRLQEIGFLEETGQTFKIPMLYRDGLQIVQGKAFD